MAELRLIVDVQNDFLDTGSLPVPGSTEKMNRLVENVDTWNKFDHVIFTKDFHPSNHCGFIENGGEWPTHCVQGTAGSEIYKPLWDKIFQDGHGKFQIRTISKGCNPGVEEYSCFAETNESGTLLKKSLETGCEYSVIHVYGIVGTICVKAHIQELIKMGLRNKLFVHTEYIANLSSEGDSEFVKFLKDENIKYD